MSFKTENFAVKKRELKMKNLKGKKFSNPNRGAQIMNKDKIIEKLKAENYDLVIANEELSRQNHRLKKALESEQLRRNENFDFFKGCSESLYQKIEAQFKEFASTIEEKCELDSLRDKKYCEEQKHEMSKEDLRHQISNGKQSGSRSYSACEDLRCQLSKRQSKPF